MPTLVTTGSSGEPKPRVVRRRVIGPRRASIVFTLLMFLIVLMLMFASDFIPSKSMEPTLQPGDHVLALRAWFAYPMNAMPARGDIITFRIPVAKLDGVDAQDRAPAATASTQDRAPAATASTQNAPPDPDSDPDDAGDKENFSSFFQSHPDTEVLIKRVIGLPGDKVLLKGNTVYINGRIVKEAYKTIPPDTYAIAMSSYAVRKPLVVPPGELFVIGDNRNNSDDGRFWGTLKRRYVIGRFVHTLYNEGAEGPNVLRAQSEE